MKCFSHIINNLDNATRELYCTGSDHIHNLDTSAADPDIKHTSGYGWPTNKAREYPRLAGYQICKIQYVPDLNLYPVRSIASETIPGVNRNYYVHIT